MSEVCAGCGVRYKLARTDDVRAWLSAVFTFLNTIELTKAGWTYEGRRWWCKFCTRRRRLIRALPPLKSNVTDAPSPTEEKK